MVTKEQFEGLIIAAMNNDLEVQKALRNVLSEIAKTCPIEVLAQLGLVAGNNIYGRTEGQAMSVNMFTFLKAQEAIRLNDGTKFLKAGNEDEPNFKSITISGRVEVGEWYVKT